MVEDIETVIEIGAPRRVVWMVLTEPQLVALWMSALRYRPEVGHIFYMQPDRERREEGDIEDAIACRIETLDEPRRLGFSWGFPHVEDTWVDIRLRRIPGGTHVRLVHSGWDQFDEVETEDVRGGLGHAWHTVALPALKDVCERLREGAPPDI
jgi:uncharacterized protein YndB with AHSA1/START domain